MADIEEPFAGNGDDGSLIERQLSTSTGGSLTKIRSGTLILSGANTHTGDTNVNRGVLQVDGSITNNAFVNHNGTLAGTGTVRPEGALGTPGQQGARQAACSTTYHVYENHFHKDSTI